MSSNQEDDEYTPTTDEVREDFAFPWSPEQIGDRPARVAAFDRWLAARDRDVKAEAWDEGFTKGFYAGQAWPDGSDASEPTTPNPYEVQT